MKFIKLDSFIADFRFFYFYLGNRIFLALLLSFSVGLLDGLGLAMFLPLLQLVESGGQYQPTAGDDNLAFYVNLFDFFGLSLDLTNVLVMILFFFSLKGAFRFLESYYTVVLNMSFTENVRIEAVENISMINYKYFNQIDAGKIQNTLSSEIDRVRLAFQSYAAASQTLLTVTVYAGLAFLTNPQFALLVVVGGLFSNLVYNTLYKRTKEISKGITSINHSFHGVMMQQIHNFKYLRATGKVAPYSEKLKYIVREVSDGFKKIGFLNSILTATREPLSIAVVVVVILVQTTYFQADLGSIILSLLFFYRSLNQLIIFQNHWNTFYGYSGSLIGYKEFIDEIKANTIDYNNGKDLRGINRLELRQASFGYDHSLLLKDINLTIEKNTTIALVGQSGSGKTTLTNIITGLLPLHSGSVLVNGSPLGEINIQQFQSHIGYITQDPVIFNDTLFNNVTFWDKKTPENLTRFMDCIRKASLLDFFDGLDLKADAPLGNNGVMVSGGQKQRIAIARELYKKVDLMILDEATSALDSATERDIQAYFESNKGNMTFVIIAHRLSTIKNADQIYLLKKGKIEASGTFLELQQSSEEFRRMVELQDFGKMEPEEATGGEGR